MAFVNECQRKMAVKSLIRDELKEENLYLLKMIKLESLKKSDHFKLVLKGKKTHTNLYSIFRVVQLFSKSEIFEECRKAVLEKNIHAVFRVLLFIENSYIKDTTYIYNMIDNFYNSFVISLT